MSSVVEAELAFLEEQRKALPWNPVVLAQYALGLVPEVLDAVDVITATGELSRMVDAHVVELTDVQRVVAAEAIGIDHAVRGDFPLDYRHQRGCPGVVDDLGVDLSATLEQAEYNDLTGGTTTTLAFADATKVALVQLNGSVEDFVLHQSQLVGNQLTQLPVVERSSVGLEPKHTGRRTGGHFEHEELD